ncbi:MAG: FAD-dependent oxidoreductase [Pirellulales bacterium]
MGRAVRRTIVLIGLTFVALICAELQSSAADEQSPSGDAALYLLSVDREQFGRLPLGWTDRVAKRPNANWIVDTHGHLRFVRKRETGLVTYDGYLQDGTSARESTDARIRIVFPRSFDAGSMCGIAVRVQDARSYYLARFYGDGRLQWVVVDDGTETIVSEATLGSPHVVDDTTSLEVRAVGDGLTAQIIDDFDQVRIDMRDARFKKGSSGVAASPYVAIRQFEIFATHPKPVVHTREQVAKRNARAFASNVRNYPIVRVDEDFDPLLAHPANIGAEYDVVVAGAGTGGCGAAIQAARMGCRVLLLEETDWIGGQMAAAGVTTMDEDSVWMKFPVRGRGIYREFHESVTAHYYSRGKDPYVAYYGNPQMEGGYEPRIARGVLYALLKDAGEAGAKISKRPPAEAAPLVSLRSRIEAVRKEGNAVKGVTVETVFDDGSTRRTEVACRVLIDATEYGDVLPLVGVPYRVSNQKVPSDAKSAEAAGVDLASAIQDHTWTAIVREYRGGVPEHLQIKLPPPDYEDYSAKRFKKFQLYGLHQWGVAAKGIKGPRDYRVYFAWRGMADSNSPLFGTASEMRHTQCGFNGGNDYSVSAGTCEDSKQRLLDERRGIYLTLGALYYFQQELGLPWSLAADEGYDTPYNRAKMKALDLRSDLEPLARHLPQMPYVRESRRMIGVGTLKAADLGRYENAKHVAHSVAMGDYFMDLDHGRTAHLVETDLDKEEPPRGGGPFQVPMEVFLPEKIDGFLPAEKNFSQSRLASGATRLQPITLLTGQAVGTMAALAVRKDKQPRELTPQEVQGALLDSGSTLIQRWYADVSWGTPIWKATQLLSLHEVLDRPGAIDKDNTIPLGSKARWGVDEPLTQADLKQAVTRLCEMQKLAPPQAWPVENESLTTDAVAKLLIHISPSWGEAAAKVATKPGPITAGQFALIVSDLLLGPSSQAK